jgi:hypothetical protein
MERTLLTQWKWAVQAQKFRLLPRIKRCPLFRHYTVLAYTEVTDWVVKNHKARNVHNIIFKRISAYDICTTQHHKFCINVLFLNLIFLVKAKTGCNHLSKTKQYETEFLNGWHECHNLKAVKPGKLLWSPWWILIWHRTKNFLQSSRSLSVKIITIQTHHKCVPWIHAGQHSAAVSFCPSSLILKNQK